MTNYGHFKNDLALGQKYEKLAQDKMMKHLGDGISVTEERTDNRYDFQLTNGTTYEVKFDRMASKTGNIYLETASHGRDAGLSVSQADFYIYCISEHNTEYLLMKTADLKQLIADNKYWRKHSDAIKTGYLFKLSVIRAVSIDIAGKDEKTEIVS